MCSVNLVCTLNSCSLCLILFLVYSFNYSISLCTLLLPVLSSFDPIWVYKVVFITLDRGLSILVLMVPNVENLNIVMNIFSFCVSKNKEKKILMQFIILFKKKKKLEGFPEMEEVIFFFLKRIMDFSNILFSFINCVIHKEKNIYSCNVRMLNIYIGDLCNGIQMFSFLFNVVMETHYFSIRNIYSSRKWISIIIIRKKKIELSFEKKN